MKRFALLVLLITCIVLVHANPLNERRQEQNEHYVVTRPPQEVFEKAPNVSNIDNDSQEKLSDISNKTTQKPNRHRPTKKPGTYIQSIWDIYGQRD